MSDWSVVGIGPIGESYVWGPYTKRMAREIGEYLHRMHPEDDHWIAEFQTGDPRVDNTPEENA